MNNKVLILLAFWVLSIFMVGCVSVPMASLEDDVARKQFSSPPEDVAGLYIFRRPHSSRQDILLKKALYIDGDLIGDSLPNKFFYREIKPGSHEISTESEFSNNDLTLFVESGKNYFVRQYVKMGLLSAGAGIEQVQEGEGKSNVLKCKLAK